MKISESRKKELLQFLHNNNLICDNLELLNKALTHSSYTNENNLSSFENYERLEFLGDAVLKLISSRYLYEKFENYDEGILSKIRAALISDNTLSKFASKIDLGKYMIFGPAEKKLGGENRKSSLACAFEALLGALYLDNKGEITKNFLLKFLKEETPYIETHLAQLNAKSTLQEYTQEKYKTLPEYKIINETGPAHKKTFEIQIEINGQTISTATGDSKKEAQQNAAYLAIKKLGLLAKEEEQNV